MRYAVLFCIALTACAAARQAQNYTERAPSPANVAHYRGCPVFTAGDWYNAPIANAPIEPDSAAYIASMKAHGDDSGFVVYNDAPTAYKINLASNATLRRPVRAPRWHQNEFPNPVPWQRDFYISPLSDGHAIVLNTSDCTLTEFYQAMFSNGTLSAYSGWTWDLRRPLESPTGNQPSSTASGLPELPGMLKGEEIESSGAINHALNFAPPEGSISPTRYVAPAVNNGGSDGLGPIDGVPYGAHFRLRRGFQLHCAGDCPQAQRIVAALKNYGAFISDTGSKGTGNQLFVSADTDGRNPWNDADLSNLQQIHIEDMDILRLGTVLSK